VYEETGLKVEPGPLTGVYQNMARNIVALVFRCRSCEGRLRSNAEAAAFLWATPNEVADLMDEAYATRVLDAIASDGGVPVRPHDGVRLV
jgi:8-oxo-dGTP diphosphatase